MVNRIADEDALNVPADFDMFLDISSVYPEKNPDGSNPTVILNVKGSSVKFALTVLKQLHESAGEMLVEQIITDNADEVGVDVDSINERDDVTDEEMGKIDAFMETVVVPWREFTISVNAVMDGAEQEVAYQLSAPTYALLVDAFEVLSSDEFVNRAALNFLPVYGEEDDYDYYLEETDYLPDDED